MPTLSHLTSCTINLLTEDRAGAFLSYFLKNAEIVLEISTGIQFFANYNLWLWSAHCHKIHSPLLYQYTLTLLRNVGKVVIPLLVATLLPNTINKALKQQPASVEKDACEMGLGDQSMTL